MFVEAAQLLLAGAAGIGLLESGTLGMAVRQLDCRGLVFKFTCALVTGMHNWRHIGMRVNH